MQPASGRTADQLDDSGVARNVNWAPSFSLPFSFIPLKSIGPRILSGVSGERGELVVWGEAAPTQIELGAL